MKTNRSYAFYSMIVDIIIYHLSFMCIIECRERDIIYADDLYLPEVIRYQ